MKCNHCGAEIPDDSVFCEHCGKKIEDSKPTNGRKEKKPWWKRKWVIACECVLLIGIVLGIIGIINGSRWGEISAHSISSWPQCRGGNGTFYVLQKGNEKELVRVKGEFPIRIKHIIGVGGYVSNSQIYMQEGDNNGLGIFAILYNDYVEFTFVDTHTNNGYDLSEINEKGFHSDEKHIYGLGFDSYCGKSNQVCRTLFSSNRQPVRIGDELGEWQYINKEGVVAISETFKDAHPFCFGVAKVYSKHDGSPYYIRPDGSMIFTSNDYYKIVEGSDFHYDHHRDKIVANVNLSYVDSDYVWGILIDTTGMIIDEMPAWNEFYFQSNI